MHPDHHYRSYAPDHLTLSTFLPVAIYNRMSLDVVNCQLKAEFSIVCCVTKVPWLTGVLTDLIVIYYIAALCV